MEKQNIAAAIRNGEVYLGIEMGSTRIKDVYKRQVKSLPNGCPQSGNSPPLARASALRCAIWKSGEQGASWAESSMGIWRRLDMTCMCGC